MLTHQLPPNNVPPTKDTCTQHWVLQSVVGLWYFPTMRSDFAAVSGHVRVWIYKIWMKSKFSLCVININVGHNYIQIPSVYYIRILYCLYITMIHTKRYWSTDKKDMDRPCYFRIPKHWSTCWCWSKRRGIFLCISKLFPAWIFCQIVAKFVYPNLYLTVVIFENLLNSLKMLKRLRFKHTILRSPRIWSCWQLLTWHCCSINWPSSPHHTHHCPATTTTANGGGRTPM